ncbi:MAG: DUF6491 family protein [Sphingomonadaceae bacterium]|nr:DUF6491 family protein [Sphingomonadaceae bacterium]
MRINRTAVASAAALAMLATSANARPGPKRACFFADRVTGYEKGSGTSIVVEVGTRERWQLTPLEACPFLDFLPRVGLASRDPANRICEGPDAGFDADFVVPDPGGRTQRCRVGRVDRLPDAPPARRRR